MRSVPGIVDLFFLLGKVLEGDPLERAATAVAAAIPPGGYRRP